MIRHRRALVVLVVAICAVGALFTIARTSYASIDDVSFAQLRWQYVALSTVAATAFVLVYAVCWWMLMNRLEPGGAPFAGTIRLFLLSWPGRYVPGGLPYYGGRIVAAPRIGLSRSGAAASLVYENLFVVATSGSFALALLLMGFRDHFAGGTWFLLACVAAIVSLAALHPVTLRGCIRLASRRFRRLRAIEDHVLSARSILIMMAAYAVGALLSGCTFYFAMLSVSPTTDAPVLLAIAAYNLGGVAGILAVPVPSGLGVREGVTVAILGTAVAAPVALGAAVLARLIAICADLLPFVIVLSAGAFAGVRRVSVGRLEPERS